MWCFEVTGVSIFSETKLVFSDLQEIIEGIVASENSSID